LKAHAISPDDPDTLVCLTNVASQLGRHAEALEYWEAHQKKHGFDKHGASNAAFALLHMGRWAEAWDLYRGSLGSDDRRILNYHEDRETPRWRPDKHEDATVVLYGEQAIGDEIMFASMIPAAVRAAEEKSTRIIVECLERNAGLFERSFAPLGVAVYGTRGKASREWAEAEGVTHKLEFGGLGEFFGREPFRCNRFLEADPIRRAMWRVFLDQTPRRISSVDAWKDGFGPLVSKRPRVGIAWTGGSWATGRHRRSIPFHLVAGLLQTFSNEVDFVNLEYEDRREDLEMVRAHVLNPHWATRKGADYDDTAAIVANLDLVIAPTTSVVDLAGALGVECWALADEHPQWRYSDAAGHDRMFFYESVRVFRQPTWGDWAPTMRAVGEELRHWIDDNRQLDEHVAASAPHRPDEPDSNGALVQ
jgi:hypothetical protein